MESFPKKGRVVLEGAAYRKFKFHVHALDNWRCRVHPFIKPEESAIRPLQVHHMLKRSHLRLDVPANGLSVCLTCHNLIESGRVVVQWKQEGAAGRDIRVSVAKECKEVQK